MFLLGESRYEPLLSRQKACIGISCDFWRGLTPPLPVLTASAFLSLWRKPGSIKRKNVGQAPETSLDGETEALEWALPVSWEARARSFLLTWSSSSSSNCRGGPLRSESDDPPAQGSGMEP